MPRPCGRTRWKRSSGSCPTPAAMLQNYWAAYAVHIGPCVHTRNILCCKENLEGLAGPLLGVSWSPVAAFEAFPLEPTLQIRPRNGLNLAIRVSHVTSMVPRLLHGVSSQLSSTWSAVRSALQHLQGPWTCGVEALLSWSASTTLQVFSQNSWSVFE